MSNDTKGKYARRTEEKKELGINSENKTKQGALFEDYQGGKPETEWQGMPEFVQENVEEYQKIIIRFDSEADVEAFAKLIGQTITPNTKSIWYPKLKEVSYMNKRYIDES